MAQIQNGQTARSSSLRSARCVDHRGERTDQTPALVKETRVLAVLDSSEDDGRVIECLLDLAGRGMRLTVVLLNVQPKPLAWQTRSTSGGDVRDRLPAYRGKRVVRGAQRRLEPAGIATSERVEFGSTVEAIVKCAKEERCDAIVLAAPRTGRAGQWLARKARLTLGSVATEVMQRSTVPVVAVSPQPIA